MLIDVGNFFNNEFIMMSLLKKLSISIKIDVIKRYGFQIIDRIHRVYDSDLCADWEAELCEGVSLCRTKPVVKLLKSRWWNAAFPPHLFPPFLSFPFPFLAFPSLFPSLPPVRSRPL